MEAKCKLTKLWSLIAGTVWGAALLWAVYRGIRGVSLAGLSWSVSLQYLLAAVCGGLAVAAVLRRKRDGFLGVAFSLCALQVLVISPFVLCPLLEHLTGITYSSYITLPNILWGVLYILLALQGFLPRVPRWMGWAALAVGVSIIAASVLADVALFAYRLQIDFFRLGWKMLLSLLFNAVISGIPAVALGLAFRK